MKKYILLFIIILLPVFSYAQNGAKSKKPGSKDKNGNERVNTEDSAGSVTKPESSTENYDVDQTEKKTKNYSNGEPIELYDLIYMLLPDESVSTSNFNFDYLDELGIVFMFDGHEANWHTSNENVFGILDVAFNGIREVDEWSISIDQNRSKFNLGKSTPAYSLPYDEYKGTALEYLFPSKKYSFKILEKKSLENYAKTYELYEIKFPDKKSFWIAERFDSGTDQGNYYLFFYLNKNEVKKDF